ncbi:MAG: glycosyltransferase [Steroidobacteraceae bacterium]
MPFRAEVASEMTTSNAPKIVIYTQSLMERSMTFIRSHAEALRSHVAVYAGAHRVAGLALPPERSVCVNEGGVFGVVAELLFRQMAIAPAFLRKLKRMAPVAVHAHFGDSGPAGLTIARALGVPLIITFHGRDATITDEQAARSWRGREFLKRRVQLIAETDCVIAVSNFIRNRLLQQGFDGTRIVTHYNGIDTESFVPEPRDRESFVLFVGRFVEKKGCRYLLEALARLKQAGDDVRAVLIGDGPLRPELEAFARQQGLHAEFVGFLASDGVIRWMNRAMIVVVPSVTAPDGDSEGLPTVILESQAMSTPVVATAHSGIPEGVMPDESALLVPERDAGGLASAIRTLIQDPGRSRRMGEAGRRFVQQKFSITTQVAGLERIYERVRRGLHE